MEPGVGRVGGLHCPESSPLAPEFSFVSRLRSPTHWNNAEVDHRWRGIVGPCDWTEASQVIGTEVEVEVALRNLVTSAPVLEL